jgi:hypothetical protein
MEQSRLKVHRRKIYVDGQAFTALSPRPDEAPNLVVDPESESARISSDQAAASQLGQLCWAMAFQRNDHTFVVIEAGDTAVLVVNTDLATPSAAALEELRTMLPWTTESEGTVVLNTRSLETAMADEPAFYVAQKQDGIGHIKHLHRLVKDAAGLLVIGAPAVVLKSWAVQLSTPTDSRPTWFATT